MCYWTIRRWDGYFSKSAIYRDLGYLNNEGLVEEYDHSIKIQGIKNTAEHLGFMKIRGYWEYTEFSISANLENNTVLWICSNMVDENAKT